MNTFKYLGATLADNGDLDADMTRIIQSGWTNWKRVSRILSDPRISLRVKSKVYKTVVRPAMMYGAETWAVKKAQEKKLDVAEMSMLRWMSGVTKVDRIRNERIRGTTKVGQISKRRQIRWQKSDVDGGAGEKKERKTEADMVRLDNIKTDVSERELLGEEAQYRVQWRRLIRNIDPTYKWENMRKTKKNRSHFTPSIPRLRPHLVAVAEATSKKVYLHLYMYVCKNDTN